MSSKPKTTTTKEEAKPALVPKLRFPEFRGAEGWEQKNLGGLCKIRTGKKDANEGASDGEYPFFTCAENHIYSRTYSFDAEAILVAGNANVGQTRYYNGKFEAYQRTYVLTDFSGISVPYLYAILNANLRESLLGQVQTSAMSYIKLPMLQEYGLPVPPTPAEQQKIAECLSSVDELIAAQARKLDALKTHKKGLMQQLFPREGETQPRLRFPEFQNTGEWDVKPLGELVELQSGFAFSSSNFGSEGMKLVTPKNFTKHGHGNFDESISKYTTEDVPKRFVCKPGDLLVLLTDLTPTCELLGKPLLLEERDGVVLLNQRVVRVEASASKLGPLFLKYVFLSEAYNRRIIKTATGSTVKHSSNKILQEMPLAHPSLNEQQRIADCLTSLDDIIAAQTQTLEALKSHKQGLMQQLFPSPEAVAV